MSLIITAKDYLSRELDIRWKVTSTNRFTNIFGEETNAYMVVVVDEKNSNSKLFKGTIIKLYMTVVFVVGRTLSNFLKIFPETIWTIDLPEAEQILQICDAIVIARSDEKLDL